MSISEALLYGIQNGYGMTLRLTGRTGGHSVALWGGDYTNYGDIFNVTSLYFTDSDSQGGLNKASVEARYEEGQAGGSSSTNYYLKTGGQEWKIFGVDFLYHTQDNVPEPASSLLFMAGMTALCWRRRY